MDGSGSDDEDFQRAIKASLADQQRENEKMAVRPSRAREPPTKRGKDDEVVEVVPLNVFSLVLLMTDDELLATTMSECGVVLDFPTVEDGESSSFMVVSGQLKRNVEAAKQRLLRKLGEEPKEEVEERKVELLPSPVKLKVEVEHPNNDCSIFVDSSNVLIGALNSGVVLDVTRLVRLIEQKRNKIVGRFSVGSMVKGYGNLLEAWSKNNYVVRGFKNRGAEELHDDALQNMISRLLFVNIQNKMGGKGKTIVLCTGDGNRKGSEQGGQDFPSLVKIALQRGFDVEVWAWRAGCSGRFMAFLTQPHFRLYFFDDFMDRIIITKE